MGLNKEWYSLCYEDIADVAIQRGIKLTPEELERVVDVASDTMDWWDTVSNAIDVVKEK